MVWQFMCRYGAFDNDDYNEEDHLLFQQNQGVGEHFYLPLIPIVSRAALQCVSMRHTSLLLT